MKVKKRLTVRSSSLYVQLAYPGFYSLKAPVVLLSALNLICWFPYVCLGLWEFCVLPKNAAQWPRLGLQPVPPDPELTALTVRSLHLHYIMIVLLFSVMLVIAQTAEQRPNWSQQYQWRYCDIQSLTVK